MSTSTIADGVQVARCAEPTSTAPLPTDAVLLHIGPHKTGTSAIQAALGASKQAMAEHGVAYLGRPVHREQAPLAVLNRTGRSGIRTPKRWDWDVLLHDVRSHPDERVVLSSERYCWASADQAARIVEDLGHHRTHVVVTLRRLDRILPSQWQMSVQGGLTKTYDQWLADVFSEAQPAPREAKGFWRRQAHGALVERWVAAAGADRVTVVVVDDTDHAMLPGAFAALLGLPQGLLHPVPDKSNRSLTVGEVEFVRQVNLAFEDKGWSPVEHAELVRRGVARRLLTRAPASDEPRITTPLWALEGAARRAEESIAVVGRSGARVIGDLEQLRITPSTAAGGDALQAEAHVPAAAGALALLGALERIPRRPTVNRDSVARRMVPDRLGPAAVRGRRLVLALRARARSQPRKV